MGQGEGVGPAVEKIWAAKKRRKKEGLGREIKGREKREFAFLKLIQTIQFKLKFREFKFELNNKQ